MLITVLILALLASVSIAGRFWAVSRQLHDALGKQSKEMEALVDKTLALDVSPASGGHEVGLICVWTGKEWKPYTGPTQVKPARPVVEASEVQVASLIRSSFEATFGGSDPSFEPRIKALTDALYADSLKVFTKPPAPAKKSLLTPHARTCHDCVSRGVGVTDNLAICLKAKSKAEMYRACTAVLESLEDPLNCPSWEKQPMGLG